MSRTLVLCIAMIFAVLMSDAAAACELSDIQIRQADLVRNGPEGLYSTIVGRIVNGCGEAIGVQLHVALWDRAGNVISTDDPSPAGITNIPPYSTYAFTLNAPEETRPAAKLQIDVEQVKKW